MILYAAKFVSILLLAFGFNFFPIPLLLVLIASWTAINFYYITLLTFLGILKISFDFDSDSLKENWAVLLLNTVGVVCILKMTAYTVIGWMLVPSIVFAVVCSIITTLMYFGVIEIGENDD